MISSGTKSTTHQKTDALEDLDFDFQQPCEHSQHGERHKDQPAMFYIRLIGEHGACYDLDGFFLCLSGWENAGRNGLICRACGTPGVPREEFWQIVRVIGT